ERHDGGFGIEIGTGADQCLGTAEGRTAETKLDAVDHGPHALPGLLDSTDDRRSAACGLCDRSGHRMMARQRKSAGELKDVGACGGGRAARERGGTDGWGGAPGGAPAQRAGPATGAAPTTVSAVTPQHSDSHALTAKCTPSKAG